jgi:hypothetical protein
MSRVNLGYLDGGNLFDDREDAMDAREDMFLMELEADMAAKMSEEKEKAPKSESIIFSEALELLDDDELAEIFTKNLRGNEYKDAILKKAREKKNGSKKTQIIVHGEDYEELEKDILKYVERGVSFEDTGKPEAPKVPKETVWEGLKPKALFERVIGGRNFIWTPDGSVVVEKKGVLTGFVEGKELLRSLTNTEAFTPKVVAVRKEWLPTNGQLKKLYREVLSKYDHEVLVYMCVERKDGKEIPFFFVPEQTVQRAHVAGTGMGALDAQWVGDIHTHPWPGTPSASGTDMDDMKKVMGVHLICSSKGEYRVYGSLKDHVSDLGTIDTEKMKKESVQDYDLRTFENKPLDDLMIKPVQHNQTNYYIGNYQGAGSRRTTRVIPSKKDREKMGEKGFTRIPRDEWPLPGDWVVSPGMGSFEAQMLDVNYKRATCTLVSLWGTKFLDQPLEHLFYPREENWIRIQAKFPNVSKRAGVGVVYVHYLDACVIVVGQVPGGRTIPSLMRVTSNDSRSQWKNLRVSHSLPNAEAANPLGEKSGASGKKNRKEEQTGNDFPVGVLVKFPYDSGMLFGIIRDSMENTDYLKVSEYGNPAKVHWPEKSTIKWPTSNETVRYVESGKAGKVQELYETSNMDMLENLLFGENYVLVGPDNPNVWKLEVSQRHGGKNHKTTVFVGDDSLQLLQECSGLVIRSKKKV